jgi:hypothetical protein
MVVVVVLEVLVVLDVVVVVPQTFGVPPPPQVAGAAHVPQSSALPHPFGTDPHSAPASAHVVGVQHMPNGFDPGGAPLMHAPPQHSWFVRQDCPSDLQVALIASAGSATIVTSVTSTRRAWIRIGTSFVGAELHATRAGASIGF